MRMRDIIAIEEDDVVAVGVVETKILGGREADVGGCDKFEALIVTDCGGNDFTTIVGGTVVDYEGFKVFVGLGFEGIERFGDVVGAVVTSDDDGYKIIANRHSYFSFHNSIK